MYLMITDGKTTYGEISILTESGYGMNNDLKFIDVHGWVSIEKYTDFLLKHDSSQWKHIMETFSKIQNIRGLFHEQKQLWPSTSYNAIKKDTPLSEMYETMGKIKDIIVKMFEEDFKELNLYWNED